MKIGVIGAGAIGQALTRLAVRNRHEVLLANSRGPATLGATAAALGCSAASVAQACAAGDVVILAIPFRAIEQLEPHDFAGKIVLDANNYYPGRDGAIAALDRFETTTSRLLQQRLPGARVVKFFNAIMAGDIVADAKPRGEPKRRALPIAGDDAQARQVAAELVDDFGFDAVDAGSLDESWRFERAMPAYCIPLDATQLRAALASARRGVELPHGSWRTPRQASDGTP